MRLSRRFRRCCRFRRRLRMPGARLRGRAGCRRGRGARAGPGHPAVDVALAPTGDGDLAGVDVTGEGAAGRDVGAVGDVDRRHEHGVGADERVLADRRVVLGDAVVVGEDRARADVGALADRRVAAVGEVRDLGAVADRRVLGLDEPADLALGAEDRAGAQVGERADGGAGADLGEVGLGALDLGALADLGVGEGRVGPDAGLRADGRRAEQLGSGQEDGVTADRDVAVDPRGRGVDDRDARCCAG